MLLDYIFFLAYSEIYTLTFVSTDFNLLSISLNLNVDATCFLFVARFRRCFLLFFFSVHMNVFSFGVVGGE